MSEITRKQWELDGSGKMTDAQRRMLSEHISYDPDSGNLYWVKNGRGQTKRSGALAGSPHSGGYIRVKLFGKTYFAHRLAYLIMEGKWPENQVDHINGIRSDNRWRNLRHATVGQNRMNCAGIPSRRASKFKGVSRAPDELKWKASITTNGVTKKLGRFDTESAAAEAYRKAALIEHGEFAKW